MRSIFLRAYGLALLLAIAPSVWAQCIYFDAFKDNRNGTVTDPRSGTIWQRCGVGQRWTDSGCLGETRAMPWGNAMRTAKTDKFLGRTDWRLPTKDEAESIVGRYDECTKAGSSRAVSGVFSLATAEFNWLSSPAVGEATSQAWLASFTYGGVQPFPRHADHHVRLVRAGHPTGLEIFNRELINAGQHEAVSLAEKREWDRVTARNTSKPQDGAPYTNLFQNSRYSGDVQSIWQATCQDGSRATVSKRDNQSSVFFYRQGGSTRCESISIEATVRKACAG